MAGFAAPSVVLPGYMRPPSRLRRALIVVAQFAAAALYGVGAVILPLEQRSFLILPVVLCLLIALWIMPDRGTFPRSALERMFGVLFVLMIIWPEYIAMVLPGLPWLTPTRIALFLITFLFLYSVATSAQLRGHLATLVMQSRLLWTCFVMWQVSMIVSLPFSNQIATSAKMLIDRELSYAESFFLGCLVFTRRGTATRTIGWMLALAVVCSVDGFVELRMGHPPWSFYIPSFMRVDADFLANVLGSQARSADGLYRVRGPFTNSLLFAEFLALCTPFLLHWLFTGRSFVLRATMLAAWGVMFGAIVITQSRLGLVGTIVAVGTYVSLWAFRQWRASGTSIVGPSLLFGAPLIALAMIAVILSSHRLSTRVFGGGAQAASNQGRSDQLHAAIPLIAKNPLGYGLGQGGMRLGFHAPDGKLTVDNNMMSTALDLGVLGLVGFYGMFAIAALMGTRSYFAATERESELAGPLASMFVVFLVIRWVLSEEYNVSLGLLFLGMAMALRARDLKIGNLGFE